jgi:hypothetical protein
MYLAITRQALHMHMLCTSRYALTDHSHFAPSVWCEMRGASALPTAACCRRRSAVDMRCIRRLQTWAVDVHCRHPMQTSAAAPARAGCRQPSHGPAPCPPFRLTRLCCTFRRRIWVRRDMLPGSRAPASPLSTCSRRRSHSRRLFRHSRRLFRHSRRLFSHSRRLFSHSRRLFSRSRQSSDFPWGRAGSRVAVFRAMDLDQVCVRACVNGWGGRVMVGRALMPCWFLSGPTIQLRLL